MGDFNLDLHKSESSSNSNVEAFEQFLISEGLFPVISSATHHNQSAKSKSCIDNIFTNRVETINQSVVVVNCGTAQCTVAHSPIFSTSKLNHDLKPISERKKLLRIIISQQKYWLFCKKVRRKLWVPRVQWPF